MSSWPSLPPTPAHVAKLTKARVAAVLRRAGRQREIDALAAEILAGLRQPQLRQPQLVEKAIGRQTLAPLAALDTAGAGADDLQQAAAKQFRNTPTTPSLPVFPV